MNWIKKLLQLFIYEKEEQTDIENDYKEESPKTASSSKVKVEHPKNIEAKIAYQYPKGKFRFPLIPDEEIERIKRPSPHPVQERHYAKPKTESRPRPYQHHTAPSPPVNHNEREESVYKPKKTEPLKRSNRPFKPTEVPSPIYGYKRPETYVHRGKVEYELSSFEPENRQMHMQPEEHMEVYREEQQIREIDQTEPIPLKIEALAAKRDREYINEMEPQQEEAAATVERQEEAEPVLEQEPVKEEAEVVPEMIVPAITEEMELTQKAPISEEEMELTQKAPISEEEMELTQKAPISEEEMVLKLKTPIFDKELNEAEKPKEAESVKADEPVIEARPETAEKAAVQERVPEKPSAEHENNIREKNVSHLPFNVIMLKQDKQKLEQKRKTVAQTQRKEPADKKIFPLKETEQRVLYQFPPVNLLSPPLVVEENGEWIEEQRELLNSTLKNFNVGAQVVNVTQGPSVTRFEVQPEPGVKVNKITNLSDDIKLSLAARDIRIEAPIPGKHTIGIEVPNKKSRPVLLSEIINSPEFSKNESPLTAALGLDISGKPIVTDLRKMPHGLIAGATGSGKSVCINTILVSLLYKAKPEELKLLLIDPKMVELAPYNQIPHLVSPVITDVKAATASLKWAVDEMERRYELFAHTGVRDIHRFNEQAEEYKRYADKLPYIVIIIDELADLMMMSPADVEEAICRIAQKARACGIHLIIATQRPSVDVITGLIKANIPTRIAFSVSSQVDSRTIIDMSGAEKLLGKGDMLFLENGSSKPVRLQGTFVSDLEIDEVVAYARKQGEPHYLFEQEELLKKTQINDEEDELFYEACEFIVDHGGASTSSLQRRFKIGYNRAARLIDMMEKQGFISESRGSKPRDVLITEEDLETIQESSIIN